MPASRLGIWKQLPGVEKMMVGHKMDYFVMELSFIGWYILNSFTYGILLLWLQPYYQLSFANFYVKIAQMNQTEQWKILIIPIAGSGEDFYYGSLILIIEVPDCGGSVRNAT